MMKTNKTPEHCKGCKMYWRHGINDGTHNNWCTKYSNTAPKSVGHCKNINGKELNDE